MRENLRFPLSLSSAALTTNPTVLGSTTARKNIYKRTTHVSPEGPEIRSPTQHHPPRPNSGHGTEHPEPRCRYQGSRPARQGQRPALQQRADRGQHLERGSIEVLDEDPGARGGGAG